MLVMQTRVPVDPAVVKVVPAVILVERHMSVLFSSEHFHVKRSECCVNFSDLIYHRSTVRHLVQQNLPNKALIRKLLLQQVNMQNRADRLKRRRGHACRWEHFGENLDQKHNSRKLQRRCSSYSLTQQCNLLRELPSCFGSNS